MNRSGMSLNFADLYLASKAALSNSVHISVHHIQWRILALYGATPNSLKFITLTFNKTAISSRKMEKKNRRTLEDKRAWRSREHV